MAEPRRPNVGGYRGPSDRDRTKISRSGRGRPRERPRSGRGNPGGGNMDAGMRQTPTILARDKRVEQATPGMISIIRREPSGSHISSPPQRGPSSPGSMTTPISPGTMSPRYPQPMPLTIKTRYDKEEPKGRPLRKTDGMSSNPSSYTPLQPTSRAPRERDGTITRSDHAVFMNSSTEMNHAVKLIDKNWQFDDRVSESFLDQSDFLVVGCLGKQGVGKSTVMSLLAGTRTGSGKPPMFRTQSKEVHASGSYQTTGIDLVVTGERILLLDTQAILSDIMLEQFIQNDNLVPAGMSPETYMEILSLQLAIFLYTVCHVVVVVVDSVDSMEVVFRFLWMVETLKPLCVKTAVDVPPEAGDRQPREHLPQLVFVLNHASPDDFQPMSLREIHCFIADNFQGAKVGLAGGVSLATSGLVPIGRGFPAKKQSRTRDDIAPGEVNMFLLPTIHNSSDSYGSYCVNAPERLDPGLSAVFSLLPTYVGHPSFQLLSETFRNRVFSMPRPPLRPTTQQQLTEKEWFEYARRLWMMVKKSDISVEYERILQTKSPT